MDLGLEIGGYVSVIVEIRLLLLQKTYLAALKAVVVGVKSLVVNIDGKQTHGFVL